MPTWADIRHEYAQELPDPAPAQLFVLSDAVLIDFIRARPARRAGGLDAWTTRKAKALPDAVLSLFAQMLRAMQRIGVAPKPLLHPEPLPSQR